MCILKSKSRWLLAALVLLLGGLLLAPVRLADAATSVSAQLNPGYTIIVDGTVQNFFTSTGNPVYPLVYNGTTYLPLRAIGELMNKNVNWDEASLTVSLAGSRTAAPTSGRAVSARQQYVNAELRPDFTIMVDGMTRSFYNSDGSRVYPLLYNGSIYLPLRAIGELMGKNVDWDGNTATISLYSGSSSGLVTDADSFGSTTVNNQPAQNPGNQVNPGNQNNQVNQDMLTNDQAIAKALANVPGAAASNVTKVKLDYDDGRYKYDVDIYYNSYEYDLEIDAYTGALLDMSKEYEPYAPAQNQTQISGQPQTPSQGQAAILTNDQARAAALANVPGATVNNITKLKLEYDDGRWKYEVEIYYNFYEYDLEIDAYTGALLDMDSERQDYFYNQAHHSQHHSHGYGCGMNCGYYYYGN